MRHRAYYHLRLADKAVGLDILVPVVVSIEGVKRAALADAVKGVLAAVQSLIADALTVAATKRGTEGEVTSVEDLLHRLPAAVQSCVGAVDVTVVREKPHLRVTLPASSEVMDMSLATIYAHAKLGT